MAPTRHLPLPRRVRPRKLASTVPSSSTASFPRPLVPPPFIHLLQGTPAALFFKWRLRVSASGAPLQYAQVGDTKK
jgi:hypothetical protein